MYRIKFDSSGGELSNSTVLVSFLEGGCEVALHRICWRLFWELNGALTLESEGFEGNLELNGGLWGTKGFEEEWVTSTQRWR